MLVCSRGAGARLARRVAFSGRPGAFQQHGAGLLGWSQHWESIGEQLCEASTSGQAGGDAAGSRGSELRVLGPHHTRRIFNFAGQSDVAKRYHEKKLLG